MQEYVDSLIQEVEVFIGCYLFQEMKTFRPKNYLAEWSIPEMQFEDDAALKVGSFF